MTRLTDLQDPYRQTKDATAVATDIATGKTAYGPDGLVTGTGVYSPAMMEFDGSTGWYSDATPTGMTGNKQTVVARFKIASFTGGGLQRLVRLEDTINNSRLSLLLYASDHTTTERRSKIEFYVSDSAGAGKCHLLTIDVVADDTMHTVFASYDGDNGNATFYIDGVDADDTGFTSRVAPATGTLGSPDDLGIGANNSGANKVTGDIGFVGMDNTYLTNWSDFMETDGRPKQLDESGWTEWGAQPLFWNEAGDMINNLGSAGNMTKNGTIIVGKGGNVI